MARPRDVTDPTRLFLSNALQAWMASLVCGRARRLTWLSSLALETLRCVDLARSHCQCCPATAGSRAHLYKRSFVWFMVLHVSLSCNRLISELADEIASS